MTLDRMIKVLSHNIAWAYILNYNHTITSTIYVRCILILQLIPFVSITNKVSVVIPLKVTIFLSSWLYSPAVH